jgi:hypothetical protein
LSAEESVVDTVPSILSSVTTDEGAVMTEAEGSSTPELFEKQLRFASSVFSYSFILLIDIQLIIQPSCLIYGNCAW